MQINVEYPYFFTATIQEWKHLLKPDNFKDIIVSSLAYMAENNRMKIFAFIIMSNHIHVIWQNIPPLSQVLSEASLVIINKQSL